MEDLEEIPEDESEEEVDKEIDEEEEDDSDAKYEVIDPPYMARVPAHRWGYNGPTPPWAYDLERWSRHQGKHPPFGMDRGFYDLRHGRPANHAIPVMV